MTVPADAAAQGGDGVQPVGAGAPQAGGAQSVPYERFKQVNDELREAKGVLDNLSNDPDFEKFVEVKRSGKSLSEVLDAQANAMSQGGEKGEQVPADDMRKLIREEVGAFADGLRQEIEPLTRDHYETLYDKQVTDAEKAYPALFKRGEHLDEVKALQRQNPGLSVSQAFRLTEPFMQAVQSGGLRAQVEAGNAVATAETPGAPGGTGGRSYADAVKRAETSGDWTEVIKAQLASES